ARMPAKGLYQDYEHCWLDLAPGMVFWPIAVSVGIYPVEDLRTGRGGGRAWFQQHRSRAWESAPVPAEARLILGSAGRLSRPRLALESALECRPSQSTTHGGCPVPRDAPHLAPPAAAGPVRPGQLGGVRRVLRAAHLPVVPAVEVTGRRRRGRDPEHPVEAH